MRFFLTLISFAMFVSLSLRADDKTLPSDAVQRLALAADAVVIARVGTNSALPEKTGGSLALWVEHALKGKLRAGRDIIWVPKRELAKADVGAQLWLLFLEREGSGQWHVLAGDNNAGIIAVDSKKAPVVASVQRYLGSYGPPAEPDAIDIGEMCALIKRAARGSQESRRAAYLELLKSPDSVRPQLLATLTSDDREEGALARTLLPLTIGGPVVNGLRLGLDPETIELPAGEKRILTVHFANLTETPIRIVTGLSTWGDNVRASAAYDVRPLADPKKPGAPLATVLPNGYGEHKKGELAPLPVVNVAPDFSTLPVAVELSVEKISVDGKDVLRLKFPHGHVDLPGAGKYGLRCTFACPGPRADQDRLIEQNFWRGGQLVSNEVVVDVK